VINLNIVLGSLSNSWGERERGGLRERKGARSEKGPSGDIFEEGRELVARITFHDSFSTYRSGDGACIEFSTSSIYTKIM